MKSKRNPRRPSKRTFMSWDVVICINVKDESRFGNVGTGWECCVPAHGRFRTCWYHYLLYVTGKPQIKTQIYLWTVRRPPQTHVRNHDRWKGKISPMCSCYRSVLFVHLWWPLVIVIPGVRVNNQWINQSDKCKNFFLLSGVQTHVLCRKSSYPTTTLGDSDW